MQNTINNKYNSCVHLREVGIAYDFVLLVNGTKDMECNFYRARFN